VNQTVLLDPHTHARNFEGGGAAQIVEWAVATFTATTEMK